MIDEKKRDEPPAPTRQPETKQKTVEPQERKVVLGQVKTDEEARLAAEIEKLRGQG
jgi:hypothetical protein